MAVQTRKPEQILALRETVDIDLELVARLIEQEEASLEPKHRASLEYRAVAERTVAGGVASSWQDAPPHAVFIDRGQGNRIWDIDGNEDIDVVGENLVDRFGLPLWRFCNSGTEATLEAARLMRAVSGREMLIKIEGSYHGHHDALMFSVVPDPDLIGDRDHPITVPQAMGIPDAFAELVRVVPFNDLQAVERALDELDGRVAGMIVEPAMMN